MQVQTQVSVTVPPITCFHDLMTTASALTQIEGNERAQSALKMNVAAGDLAACLTEGHSQFEEVCDEVAALVLRGIAVGQSFGMGTKDLMAALTRESERLADKGLTARVADCVTAAGLQMGSKAVVFVPAPGDRLFAKGGMFAKGGPFGERALNRCNLAR